MKSIKPRLFIGSSAEGLAIANAIHSVLQRDAECTVWNVASPLSGSTLSSLMEQVRNSDFAAMVFTPDDATEMRRKLFSTPRDNVVYELGLFSGFLGPERCFFVVPQTSALHIPSDLLGVTSGTFEDSRGDQNCEAAVAPFCNKVRSAVTRLGLAHVEIHEHLRDLATKFECCEWVEPLEQKIRQKQAIVRV